MARSADWAKLVIAQGDPKPSWPLPSVTPKFATWSVGGGRPASCKEGHCERWHAGIDLTNAPDGAVIIAPEDAMVVGIDKGWSEGSKAAFLRTNTGLFLVLGGFKAGSHKEFGIVTAQQVRKGDKLGRVLGSYGMIHLETYDAGTRKANSVWWSDDPPPAGLLNPTNYVERMVGDKVSMLQTRQRLEALKTLGFFAGDVAGAWDASCTEALTKAQKALGVGADGKWGPETEDAIHTALALKKGDCIGDECSIQPEGTPSDPLANVGRLGLAIAGGAFALTLGVAALVWRRR